MTVHVLPENDHRASGKVRGGSAPAVASARLELGTPRLEAAGHISQEVATG